MFLNNISTITFIFAFINCILGQEDNFLRPCPDQSNSEEYLTCIKKYFAENSACSPDVAGLGDGAVPLEPMVLELPYSNKTHYRTNEEWSGLQTAYIGDFYINQNTSNAVLKVVFPDLTIAANVTIKYHHVGKEDTSVQTYTVSQFGNVITTTVMSNENGLDYKNSKTYGYVSEFLSLSFAGELDENSTDPEVIAKIQEIRRISDITIQEMFLTRSPILLDIYVNKQICLFD